MAVKIRERNGAWWIFIDHDGKRKAKKVGTKAAAEKIQKQIEARLTLGDLRLLEPKKPPEPTFAEFRKSWLEQAPASCKDSTTRITRTVTSFPGLAHSVSARLQPRGSG